MLLYTPPYFQKFPQDTPCLSHSPMPLFGITVDSKETRNTITSEASIFGTKLGIERRQKFLFILDFLDNSIV
jgi:hypothetical protein